MMKQKAKSDGRVYAMKDGGMKCFSDFQWNSGVPQKVGWVECGKPDAIPEVETEQVEIQTVEIPKDEVVKETPEVEVEKEVKKEPTLEEMREYLNGLAEQGKIKGTKTPQTKPHHMTGEVKLKALYDENTK